MAKFTNIDDANQMVDELTKSLATQKDAFTALQTKHSELITQNGNLVKEKAELWDLVATGKKPAQTTEQKSAAVAATKENKLDDLDM